MIPVDSLLYKIDQKLNKLSSNEHQQIQLEDKILALNEAQVKLVKLKMDGTDKTRRRQEDLQALVVENLPLPLAIADASLNRWAASVKDLEKPYMSYRDGYVIASKGICRDRRLWINNDLVKHGDIQFLLNNVHYRPSFEYQETFNTLADNEISIYTDGTFTPSTLHLTYTRYPVEMDKAGYIKLDGSPSMDVDCELAPHLEDELLDLTVRALAMYTENGPAANSAQIRINENY